MINEHAIASPQSSAAGKKHMCPRPWDDSVPGWAVRLGFSVILSWLCVGGMFVRTAPEFMGSTGANLDPPSNSRAVVAGRLLFDNFPNSTILLTNQITLVVSTPYDMTTTDDIAEYSQWVVTRLNESIWPQYFHLAVRGYFLPSIIPGYDLSWMLSPDKRTTVLQVFAETNYSNFKDDLVEYFRDVIVQDDVINGSGTVEMGGEYVLNVECEGKAEQSLQRMEMVVVPFAFVILAYFLKRVQMLVIPLCCICLSLGASFSFALPIAKRWNAVSNDTPEVMVSTAVALSIDYSLFLLTRFLEGQAMGLSQWHSIADMVVHTGHTISVSGMLIALAFVSSLLMPIETIRSAGALTAITAITTVVTNLTLAPAFLVCFGRILMVSPVGCIKSAFRCITCRPKEIEYEKLETDDEDIEDPLAPPGTRSEADMERIKGTVWYKLADFTRRRSTLVIIIVLIIGGPLVAQIPNLKISVDRNLTRTRDAHSLQVTRDMEAGGIEVGRLTPACIITTCSTPGCNMMDEAEFNTQAALADKIFTTFDNTTGTLRRNILQGPSIAHGLDIDFATASYLANKDNTDPVAQAYQSLLEEVLGVNDTGVLTAVYTPFRAFGPKGGDWIRRVRAVLDVFNKEHKGKYVAYVAAVNAMDLDSALIVESHLPFIIGMICVAVMLIVGAVFRSLLLPFRLAFALAYTIAVTLGFAVVVYQTKAFWWLFPYLKNFEGEGLGYAVPAVVIPVCIALGLDYDIFLLTRVIEYRKAGFSDDESVVMGVASTGSTISGAGLIMSIAFGGLLASNEVQLNQFGFLLTVSVLLDTFVIRTIFVPALMLKASRYNWWPRQMPPVLESPPCLAEQSSHSVDRFSLGL